MLVAIGWLMQELNSLALLFNFELREGLGCV